MKELLHEYGFLIIAVVVIVGLITIVTFAKQNVKKSADDTVQQLNTMANAGVASAVNEVKSNIGNQALNIPEGK